jgi:alternate signal-mediated exported protein
MNKTSDARVVSRRRKGIIAGVAGAAMLLTGSTFALWSAGDSFNTSGTITSGTMSIAADNAGVVAYDVSEDRTNVDGGDTLAATGKEGHVIDLATALIVPGDTIAITYPFGVEMAGDNLVAELKGTFADMTAADTLADEVELEYAVLTTASDETKTASAAASLDIAGGTVDFGYVANEDNEDAGKDDVVALKNGTSNLRVVLYVTFKDTVANGDLMDSIFSLQNLDITMTQVRSAGHGNFS